MPEFAWNDFKAGSMAVSKSYELSGMLGTLSDVLYDFLEFVIGSGIVASIPGGVALVRLLMAGSELSKIYGVCIVGPGGLVGVATAGAAAFLLGPSAIIPAVIGGALIGDAAVAHRSLTDPEQAFASKVFGGSIPFDNVIVTNLAGDSCRQHHEHESRDSGPQSFGPERQLLRLHFQQHLGRQLVVLNTHGHERTSSSSAHVQGVALADSALTARLAVVSNGGRPI